MPGSAERPWLIASAVTATRRWMIQPNGMPAIGNASTTASRASGAPSMLTASLRPFDAATARSRSISTGPRPASATASASSPTSRHVGAGFISVPQRSTPYSPSAVNAVRRTSR